MGDSILMKTLILCALFVPFSLFANELTWVDEQIKAIQPARDGVSNKTVSYLEDPFIFFKKQNSKKKIYKKSSKTYSKKSSESITAKTYIKGFSLDAIMNDSALINNKWYKLGQQVGTYTLKEVNRDNIILVKKGTKNIVLSTNTKNRTLKFKNK